MIMDFTTKKKQIDLNPYRDFETKKKTPMGYWLDSKSCNFSS